MLRLRVHNGTVVTGVNKHHFLFQIESFENIKQVTNNPHYTRLTPESLN